MSPGRAGVRLRGAVEGIGLLVLLALRTLATLLRPPLRLRATAYQVYVQGVRAFSLVVVMAVFAGLALAFQFAYGLGRFGAHGLLGQITTLALVRELVPVLTALVVGARLAAGIAAELGSMAVTEQIDALRVLGADPVRELVVPRVVAAALVLPLVTVIGDVIAIAGAVSLAAVEYGIGARYFLTTASRFVTAGDFLSGVLKAGGFGTIVSLLACWHGGRASGGTEGVGRATTRTVVQGALSVIVADYFLSRIFLL